MLGLCLATASAARHGVWLLCLLVVLAAGRPGAIASNDTVQPRGRVGRAALVGLVAAVVALPIVLARGEAVLGQPPTVVTAVSAKAEDRVVLAPAPLSEALAVEGVRVWATNPLDAFTHRDQAAYLDFLDGSEDAAPAVRAVDVVVARDSSPQAALMKSDDAFLEEACGPGWTCYLRR